MVNRIGFLSSNAYYFVQDALYDTALKLPMHRVEGTVDSFPSTTTMIDAKQLPNQNGLYTGGTLFLWGTDDASPASSYKASYRVTDHTGTTLTFYPATLIKLGSAAVPYSLFMGDFPRHILLMSVGNALRDMGDIPVTDTITTVENQQTYDFDDNGANDNTFSGKKILKIEIATSAEAPYNFVAHYHWHVRYDVTNGMTLEFAQGHIPPGGFGMRVTYLTSHKDILGHEDYAAPTYQAQDDLEIAPLMNHERLAWAAAVYALRWRRNLSPEKPVYTQALQEALQQSLYFQQKYPIVLPEVVRHSNWL
jgi:hypothetical protein